MSAKVSSALAALLLATSAVAGEAPSIKPAAGPLPVAGGFGFVSHPDKSRRALSGIACIGPKVCLVAFDEGISARTVELDGDAVTADSPALALAAAGSEVDAEAAAFDDGHVYVAGSQASKRGNCSENPESRVVLRAAVDGEGKIGTFQGGSVWPVLQGLDAFKDHLAGCLTDGQGVDVEALAAAGGRLYFGFRGPASGGSAPILDVAADALFADGDPDPHVVDVQVGTGRGLRDMAAVAGGFLLLAGPGDNPDDAGAGWALLGWDGKSPETRPLAQLDLTGVALRADVGGCDDKELKPEAIHYDAARQRVLVLSDGLCDGGPMWFDLSVSGQN